MSGKEKVHERNRVDADTCQPGATALILYV
jgi:hypothetical protein